MYAGVSYIFTPHCFGVYLQVRECCSFFIVNFRSLYTNLHVFCGHYFESQLPLSDQEKFIVYMGINQTLIISWRWILHAMSHSPSSMFLYLLSVVFFTSFSALRAMIWISMGRDNALFVYSNIFIFLLKLSLLSLYLV